MSLRPIFAVCAFLSLGGCSSVYEIEATVIDGNIAFVADTNFWGNPHCIYSISVSAVDGPSAIPLEGDSLKMVENGVYWNKAFAVTSCDNPFPIKYGARLQGPPFPEVDAYSVEAKPLRIGVVYEVTTSSSGSAYGGGKFKITEQRTVINLPL